MPPHAVHKRMITPPTQSTSAKKAKIPETDSDDDTPHNASNPPLADIGSDKSVPVSQLRMEELFTFNLPEIIAENHIPSTGTRGLKWFDLHLREDLRLKHVFVCPDLPRKLAQIGYCKLAESAEAGLFERYPDLPPELQPARQDHGSWSVKNEAELVVLLNDCALSPCASAASALSFGSLSHKDRSQIARSVQVSSSETASCDITLRMYSDSHLLNGSDSNGTDIRAKLALIAESGTSPAHLVVTEVKSLFAGSDSLMQAIVDQSTYFPGWTLCGQEGRFCYADKHWDKNGTLSVSGSNLDPGEDGDLSRFLDESTLRALDSLQTGDDDNEDALSERTDPNEDGQPEDRTYNSSQPRLMMCHEDGLSPTTSPRWTTQYDVIVQVWDEANEYNATFGMIHSGNRMIVWIRHRQTGSMIMSPVLSWVDGQQTPSFSVITTSLYIAAIEDALSRGQRNQEVKLNPVQTPSDCNKKPEVVTTSTSGPQTKTLSDEDNVDLMNAPYIHVKLGNGYIPPDGCTAEYAMFNRETLGVEDADNAPQHSADTRPTFYIKSAWTTGRKTTRVWFATLLDGAKQPFKRTHNVVVKVATTESQYLAMQREYRANLMLSQQKDDIASMVPQVYGLFVQKVGNIVTTAILLMANVGTPLSFPSNVVHPAGESIYSVVTNTLKQLHKGGFVHGEITSDHVIVTSGRDKRTFHVYLISLSQVRQVGIHATKECAQCLSGNGKCDISVLMDTDLFKAKWWFNASQS